MITRTYFISLLPKIKDMKFRKDIQEDVEKGKFPKALKPIHLLPRFSSLKKKKNIDNRICKKQIYKEGLPADDYFWTNSFEEWTSCKIWSGKPSRKDYKVEY